MPPKVTYYAIVDRFHSRERPSGVIRRLHHGAGDEDQAFTRALRWEGTDTLLSYEHGNMDNELYEITEKEADEIVAWIRRVVAERRGSGG
jgi:hypothetical protein